MDARAAPEVPEDGIGLRTIFDRQAPNFSETFLSRNEL